MSADHSILETPTVAAPAPPELPARPLKNMRITFWGVQGSCPIFPTGREVTDYARRIANATIERAMAELATRVDHGDVNSAEILRRLASKEGAAEFQRTIGLPDLPVYGGETTCIEVETSDGYVLVFDMGSGLRECSSHLLRKWADRPQRVLHLFGTHEHLDHRSGLPFAGFCYARQNPFILNVYSTRHFLQALDDRYGVFSRQIKPTAHADDPVDFRMMASTFNGIELRSPATEELPPEASAAMLMEEATLPWKVHDISVPIKIGKTTIQPFEVYHGSTDCLAYAISHGGVRFVFCTDHELRHGADPNEPQQARSMAAEARLVAHCQNVDLAYFDGQYFLSEYSGLRGIGLTPPVSRVGWGHGCVEDIINRSRKCGIRHTLIGHHDPERHWDERLRLDHELERLCSNDTIRIELAKQGAVIEL